MLSMYFTHFARINNYQMWHQICNFSNIRGCEHYAKRLKVIWTNTIFFKNSKIVIINKTLQKFKSS